MGACMAKVKDMAAPAAGDPANPTAAAGDSAAAGDAAAIINNNNNTAQAAANFQADTPTAADATAAAAPMYRDDNAMSNVVPAETTEDAARMADNNITSMNAPQHPSHMATGEDSAFMGSPGMQSSAAADTAMGMADSAQVPDMMMQQQQQTMGISTQPQQL